jgi:hypothetical protein
MGPPSILLSKKTSTRLWPVLPRSRLRLLLSLSPLNIYWEGLRHHLQARKSRHMSTFSRSLLILHYPAFVEDVDEFV